MPRPTDVVFRSFDELTRIDPADILPSLPYVPYYPKTFLVHFVEPIPNGKCDYWLLESGKTLRIPIILRPSRSPSSSRTLRTPPRTPQKSRSLSKSRIKSLSLSMLYKNKTPSKTLPSPPLSPTQSFCFPQTPPSRVSRLKFWKQRSSSSDYEDLDLDTTPSDDAGSEFERMMWKAERSTRQLASPSQRLIDPEDEGDGTDDDEDSTEVSSSQSSGNQNRPVHPTFVSFKQRLRAVSVSTLPPVEEGSYFPRFASAAQRTRTFVIEKEAKPNPPPAVVVKKKAKPKPLPTEHICSFLDYRADSKFIQLDPLLS